MEENESNPIGRPTDFTPELASKICAFLAEGKSMRAVCRMDGMPVLTTVFRWLREKPDFKQQYTLAKQESADALNEELMDLGDQAIELAQTVNPKASGAVVQGVKLKADNLKWAMSKQQPKKYGEKIDVTSAGKPIPILGNVSINNGNQESSKPEEAD